MANKKREIERIGQEKSKLVKIINKLKGRIRSDELKEVNRLYDKYFSVTQADIIRLRSYKNFLGSYVKVKYQKVRLYD